MKIQTLLLIFSLLFSTFNSWTQTKEIAWKSHSNNSVLFNPQGSGDLGWKEPDPVLVKIVKINDTTFVKTFQQDFGKPYEQTVYNDLFWMKPKKELDSLIAVYYPTTKLIGFDSPASNEVLKKPKKEVKKSKRDN